jgi:hypothetical protein
LNAAARSVQPYRFHGYPMVLTMFDVFVMLLGLVTVLELAYLTRRLWQRLNRAHIDKRLRKFGP